MTRSSLGQITITEGHIDALMSKKRVDLGSEIQREKQEVHNDRLYLANKMRTLFKAT